MESESELRDLVCYYKLPEGVPKRDKDTKTYDCEHCCGYPLHGCMRYTTAEHLESFQRYFGLPALVNDSNQPQPEEKPTIQIPAELPPEKNIYYEGDLDFPV